MKLLDPPTIAAALVLVPSLCWWAGRLAGRRNAPVSIVILVGGLLSLLILLAQAVAISVIEGSDVATASSRRLAEAGSGPEFIGFLVVFGVFMAMLSWSATPATFMADDRQ